MLRRGAYLDIGGRLAGRVPAEGTAEHILESHRPVSPGTEQFGDPRIGEGAQFHRCRRSAFGVSPLDRVEFGRGGHTAESQTHHLVEGRARLGEGGQSAGHRQREPLGAAVPCRTDRRADERGLGVLDAPAQCGAAEQDAHGGTLCHHSDISAT